MDVECQVGAEFLGALDGKTVVGRRGLGVTETPGVSLPGVLSLVNSSQ